MSDIEVKKSEAEVKKSTAEFDRAMQHLEETIEDSSEKVSSAVDTVQETIQKPVRKVKDARERLKQTSIRGRDMASQYGRLIRDQSQLYYRKAQDSIAPKMETMQSSMATMVGNARQRPAMIGIIAGTLVAGVGGLIFFSKRRKASGSRRMLKQGETAPIITSERIEDQAVITELSDLNPKAA